MEIEANLNKAPNKYQKYNELKKKYFQLIQNN